MTVRMDASITLSRKLQGKSCIKSYIYVVLSSSNYIRTPIRLPRFDGVWKSHGFSKQGTRVAKRRSRGITDDSDRLDRRLVISSTFSTLSPSLRTARSESFARAVKQSIYGVRAECIHGSYIYSAPWGFRNHCDYREVMRRIPSRELRFAMSVNNEYVTLPAGWKTEDMCVHMCIQALTYPAILTPKYNNRRHTLPFFVVRLHTQASVLFTRRKQ